MVSGGVDVENDMAEPQWPGAEAGDRAAGPERLGGGLGAMEKFEPVPDRVVENDQIFDVTLIGEPPRAARDFYLRGLELRGNAVERRRVGNLPTKKADPFPAIHIDHEPLLAVIHAEGERRARSVDPLQAEQASAVARPVA